MARRFFVGGNFKMNPVTVKDKRAIVEVLKNADLDSNVEVVIAPPALYLLPLKEIINESKNKIIQLAAQNCYFQRSGAYTGEISPAQLADAEIPYVILGHSERRSYFHESPEEVGKKTKAALTEKLRVILCVGETLAEREANRTAEVVNAQLKAVIDVLTEASWKDIVIAYEPVWAIGTGRVATSAQAQEAHRDIRNFLKESVSFAVAENTRIIYGGSVNAENCRELSTQPDVDGFLVGGASLKPEFVKIINVKRN